MQIIGSFNYYTHLEDLERFRYFLLYLRKWRSKLLDTGDTTVWEIMPGMARVLRVRAEMALAMSSTAAVSDTQASAMRVNLIA